MDKSSLEPKEDTAVSAKDAGNMLFAKGKFEEAADLYQKSIGLILGPNDDLYLKAVCLSNLSNCWFELGYYQRSLKQASACLEQLKKLEDSEDDAQRKKVDGLHLKNKLRMARAYFYSGSHDDSFTILKELSTCQNEAYTKRAKKMLEQVSHYQSIGGSSMPNKTPAELLKAPVRLLRTSLQEPIFEYYKYGHNDVISALAGGPSFDDQKPDHLSPQIELKEALELDILMAGINDGRHVLITIMDVWDQFRSLKKAEQAKVKVNLVCNDINIASQANFILTLVILHKIGSLAKSRKDLKTNETAARWCAVLQYMLLSFAMPPWVKDLAVQVAEEVLAFESQAAFQEAYPWLRSTSEQDWKHILPVLSYWVLQMGGSNHKHLYSDEWNDIPDVSECLSRHFVLKEPLDEGINKTPVGSGKAVIDQRKEQALEAKRQEIAKMSDINNWPAELVACIRKNLGPEATDADLVEWYIRAMNEVCTEADFDEKLSQRKYHLMTPGIALAHVFVRNTKAILPPIDFCDDEELDEAFSRIYEKNKGTLHQLEHNDDGMIDQGDLRLAEQVIEETWVSNPFMFDPLHYSVSVCSPLNFSPILDFMVDYMMTCNGADIFDEETIGRAHRLFTKDGAQSDPDLKEFFDWTSCFFWNAGHALVALCEQEAALQLEWNVGDIVSICQGYNQLGNRHFHRILLSNIPDYTGMLPIFTDVIPLLHESTKEVPCHLHLDILLNNPTWNSYSQYVFSTTAVPSLAKAAQLFGAKYLGEADSDTWREYLWINSPKANRRFEKDLFCDWLHGLFLLIVLPPVRNCRESNRVNYPNSVAAFVHVCAHCVVNLGYPIHWVSGVLDDLLATSPNKLFKTKVAPPKQDPLPLPSGNAGREQQINLTAFLTDLRTQIGIRFQQHRLLMAPTTMSFLSLEGSSSTNAAFQKYEISMPCNLCPLLHLNHNPQVQCMALLLEPTKPNEGDSDDGDNFMSMMMQRMLRGHGQGKSSIRDEIISKGSKHFHVLSCLEWKLLELGESNCLRFYLNEKDFDQMQYHYASLLRTDGWFRVGKPIQLRNARAVF